MRYKGQPVEKPQPRIIPVLREPGVGPDGIKIDNNIYFTSNVVLDYDDFDKLCPLPDAPTVSKPGQAPYQNVEDPEYKLQIEVHNKKRMDWLFLKSVEETEGLEWETIDMGDPETWSAYQKELQDAGINRVAMTNLLNEVYTFNSIDQEKIEEARQSFLATRARLANV